MPVRPAVVVAAAVAIAVAFTPIARGQATPPSKTPAKTGPAPAAEKPDAADEKDEVIPLAKIPKVVHDTLAQYAKDADVKTASKGDVDGTIVYEFDIEQGTRKLEVSITPKGAFFGSEEVIQLTDVPEAARATIAKQAQTGKLISVEKAVDKNKKTTYEAIIEKAGKQTEIAVDATGKIVSTEAVPIKGGCP